MLLFNSPAAVLLIFTAAILFLPTCLSGKAMSVYTCMYSTVVLPVAQKLFPKSGWTGVSRVSNPQMHRLVT